jgi:putative glutamine amidotransferase
MHRPLIGLTTYLLPARFGTQDTESAVLPRTYLRAVREAGGVAVLLTPDDPEPAVLDRLDGLILTGGEDVAPDRYGEPPHPKSYVRPERDSAEFRYLAGATERGLPILGICRGLQVMVVAAGGRLHQHLPDVLGHDGHRPERGPRYGARQVRLAPGSTAQALIGDQVTTACYHHQGVADPGELVPIGWSIGDELIEVVEDPRHPFALAVQWHAEETDDRRLFAALVEAAARARVS